MYRRRDAGRFSLLGVPAIRISSADEEDGEDDELLACEERQQL